MKGTGTVLIKRLFDYQKFYQQKTGGETAQLKTHTFKWTRMTQVGGE